jgi:hypothetical protein
MHGYDPLGSVERMISGFSGRFAQLARNQVKPFVPGFEPTRELIE